MSKQSVLIGVAKTSISAVFMFGVSAVSAEPNRSFAGSTTSPSNQYNQMVVRQQQLLSQPVLRQAAPQMPAPTSYKHADSAMGAMGFAPNIPIRSSSAGPAPTAGQIGSGLIESNPRMGPWVTGAFAVGQVGMGTLNSVKAVAGASAAYVQPETAPVMLPRAAFSAGMAINNFRQACNASVWNDYAKRVRDQQACVPYPGSR